MKISDLIKSMEPMAQHWSVTIMINGARYAVGSGYDSGDVRVLSKVASPASVLEITDSCKSSMMLYGDRDVVFDYNDGHVEISEVKHIGEGRVVLSGSAREKRYLQNGDMVYSTGCYLVWNEERKSYMFLSEEDDAYFMGKLVHEDDDSRPYIYKETGYIKGEQ